MDGSARKSAKMSIKVRVSLFHFLFLLEEKEDCAHYIQAPDLLYVCMSLLLTIFTDKMFKILFIQY